MKRLLIIPFLFIATGAFASDLEILKADKVGEVYRSDIAKLGNENGVQFFELHMVPDMEVKSDELDQPAIVAKGPVKLVTPESFPASETAYLGKSSSLGAKLTDIYDFVKDKAEGAYDNFKNIFNSNKSKDTLNGIQPSDVFKLCPTGQTCRNVKITDTWVTYASGVSSDFFYNQWTQCKSGWYSIDGYDVCVGNALTYLARWRNNKIETVKIVDCPSTTTGCTENKFPSPGSINYNNVSSAIDNDKSTYRDEFQNIIRNIPVDKVITGDSSLTSDQISKLLAQNSAAVANAVADAAAAVAAANADNAAAQIGAGQAAADAAKAAADAAKAAADAAKDEDDNGNETYAGIENSGFDEPYKPGGEETHDLSDRFSSFVDNVKASPLFAFSSDFFNSLPGGGSPVFEINGGETFGSHTIDLSQTFAAGLVAIKSVMLALFGFLSIRAIIMKR